MLGNVLNSLNEKETIIKQGNAKIVFCAALIIMDYMYECMKIQILKKLISRPILFEDFLI